MQRPLSLSLFIGAFLLAAGSAGADVATTAALAAKKAGILELLHQKARKALVTAAQDAAYSGYMSTHTHSADHSHSEAEGRRLKERIDRISLTVQSRFQVEEMCLIDTKGAEVSRIVGAEIAHDLATDEADAIFFQPGFAAKPRSVHISPVYMSPDADKWVLAYVTPVVVNGEKKAILHYEHGLEVYQSALSKGLQDEERFVLAVNPEGWIVSDSRRTISVEKAGDAEDAGAYFEQFSWDGHNLAQVKQKIGAGALAGAGVWETDDGHFAVAFREVENWTLLAFERQ